ncbi:hypothetical protein Ahy_A06g028482 [Arachis hypogaea]|uniref:Putative plant transposon protein domain-containing protein n=1 Tax=Arachis hypogaea TaxID=3818 RepID=A0A445CR81_ARAHY|nr:hypothetical protein Ahy_A06g028482 [Arachis hypogaea]
MREGVAQSRTSLLPPTVFFLFPPPTPATNSDCRRHHLRPSHTTPFLSLISNLSFSRSAHHPSLPEPPPPSLRHHRRRQVLGGTSLSFSIHTLLSLSLSHRRELPFPLPLCHRALSLLHRACHPPWRRSARSLPYSPALFPFPLCSRMSDKGKAIATTSKKRKHSTPSIPSTYKNYAKNPLNEEEKENQLLPSTDPTKFPNLYCKLRFQKYRTTKLNTEKKLLLPSDVRRAITSRILELGMDFVDRDLGDINISWVKKFYCNFFRPTLDSVQVRGREIMITELAIEEALQCRHLTDGTCAHQQAELAIHSMTFDFEALRRVIGLPDATWVMDATNTKPKGMLFAHLTREAKTWHMIFAHYILPTTHFSEIPMEMLLLIGCVMEGKEVYFPRLIRQCMWRAHIRGLLLFPTLVTSMAALAEDPWLDDDVTPPPPDDDDKEVTIPWGGWVHEKPPARHRSRVRAVVGTAGPSAAPSSSTAAPSSSTTPSSAPEPTYLLVQRLFRFLEREKRYIRR